MIQRWTSLLKLLLLVIPVLASGLACAEEREPINRVQANALAKSFFIGTDLASASDDPEFYTAMTVVDVPYGADQQAGIFTGLLGELRRVKWEITEDALNARLTYEMIEGSDGHGSRTTNTGRVIGSYGIVSHFDIRRSYNSSTGEELNVVEENETDRPWYEREYFRVDWSKNNVNTSWWDPLAQAEGTGTSFEAESLAYYVNDPASPDAPLFAPEDGYFDFVNKLYLKPNRISVDGEEGAACLWRGAFVIGATYPWGNCENSEITVRVSFKRVAQLGEPGFTDYEPVDWDGARMNAFGMFWQNRLGWDNHYGIVDDKIRRFGTRHNIWVESHAKDVSGAYITCADPTNVANGYDPMRDADNNGTADECEAAGAGSRCDALVGQCTIPYAKRQVRPIVWRYTVNGQDEVYFKSSVEAAWEWDTAMRIAVQAARRVECVKTNNGDSLAGTRWEGQPCDQAFPIVQRDNVEFENVRGVLNCWQTAGRRATECAPENANSVAAMDPVVVLCQNPVAASDDPLCGRPGTTVRPGDIRYHHVAVWPTRQNMSPWGYGPSLADPLTGEIISVGINVYASVTDTSAQTFLDTMRWINGEVPTDAITSGSHVRNWTRANESAGNSGAYWPRMDGTETDRRVQAMPGMQPELIKNAAALRNRGDMEALKELDTFLQATKVPNNTPGTGPVRAKIDARIGLAKGSPIEAELLNPMWLQLAGVSAGTPIDDRVLEAASPLRGLSPVKVLEQERKINIALAEVGQCILGAPEPTGLPTFAKILKTKFPTENYEDSPVGQAKRVDDMWNFLRYKMHYSVILHEMGHTFGLTHNFTGSYDKFNYRPQYWQLRTQSGQVQNACTGAAQEDPATCIGPRYFDPPTQEETDGAIWTWMHTTVMDYPGDLTHDTLGLGVYDYAAARMFYGDTVDLRDDKRFPAATVGPDGQDRGDGTPEGEAIKSMVDYAGGLFGQNVDINNVHVHHTQYQNVFQMLWDCDSVTPTAPAWWDAELLGQWDPLVDGHIVRNEVCSRAPVDYASWNDLVADRIGVFGDPKFFIQRRAKAKDGRVRVPYSMEFDWYADGGSPSAYRHDNGADMYEELVFHTSLYENRHIFDNFRNGRTNFNIYGAYQRALTRYHAKVASLTGGYAYAVEFILRKFAEDRGLKFDEVMSVNAGRDSFLYDHTVAASLGFDHFVRAMTRPQDGRHYTLSGEMLKSAKDLLSDPPAIATNVYLPNGTSFTDDGSYAIWGRPIQNELDFSNGAWNADYLNQVGSYYEKVLALQMMFEASSETINFYRFDALDARLRFVNFSHLWPEGMRQLIGVLLTDDAEMYAPRVSMAGGVIETVPDPDFPDDIQYPKNPLGWTSWTSKTGPQMCWTSSNQLTCHDYFGAPVGNAQNATTSSIAVEPNWGWEEQKFIVFWTYAYMPDNEQMDWVDSMRIFKLGSETDPSYLPSQGIEFRDPETGMRYIAKRFGAEQLFGKTWDKGIAAKMIQWSNELAFQAYVTDPTAVVPPSGQLPYLFDASGRPLIKPDPFVAPSDANNVRCDENRYCRQLRKYRALLDFTRQAAGQVGFPEPALHIVDSDPVGR